MIKKLKNAVVLVSSMALNIFFATHDYGLNNNDLWMHLIASSEYLRNQDTRWDSYALSSREITVFKSILRNIRGEYSKIEDLFSRSLDPGYHYKAVWEDDDDWFSYKKIPNDPIYRFKIIKTRLKFIENNIQFLDSMGYLEKPNLLSEIQRFNCQLNFETNIDTEGPLKKLNFWNSNFWRINFENQKSMILDSLYAWLPDKTEIEPQHFFVPFANKQMDTFRIYTAHYEAKTNPKLIDKVILNKDTILLNEFGFRELKIKVEKGKNVLMLEALTKRKYSSNDFASSKDVFTFYLP